MHHCCKFAFRRLLANSTSGRSIMLTRNKLKEKTHYEYDKLSQEDKRRLYACGDAYETLDKVPTWPLYAKVNHIPRYDKQPEKECNPELNDKIGVYLSDITRLEIDAIVNAANSELMSGGGVCGKIFSAAGHGLQQECNQYPHGCPTGRAVITRGYKLPAKLGPMGYKKEDLNSAYKSSLELMKKNHFEKQLRSIAFPCISTGIYGYPNEKAAPMALYTVRNWLEEGDNKDSVDRIIICLFTKQDIHAYHHWLPRFFPLPSEKEKQVEDEVKPVEDEDDGSFSMDEERPATPQKSADTEKKEETKSPKTPDKQADSGKKGKTKSPKTWFKDTFKSK